MEQTIELKRVTSRIAGAVKAFFATRVAATQPEFRMSELQTFVADRLGGYVAPASPDRVMRQLRSAGHLNYYVVSRHGSLYRVVS